MKRRILGEKVTHQPVRAAVKQFLDDGGIIVTLPEEKSEQPPVIGGEKYEEYESLTSIIAS